MPSNPLRIQKSQNLELSERYKAALPYFRKYSLEELLHTNSWDAERFEAILSTLGVHLRRSHLHVAIVESRTGTTDVMLRRSIESYLKSHEETMAFVAAEAHGTRVTLIVNTDADTRTVYTVLSGLRDSLAEQSYRVSLAMSAQFDFTAEIPEHFAEVEEQLEHRSFFGDDQVIYDFSRGRNPERAPAQELPIAPVLDAVRAQDREAAVGALRDFSDAIGQRSAGDATYARFAFLELALAVGGILPETAWGEGEIDRRHRFCKRIHDSEHTGELDAFLEEIVTTTIQQLHRVKSEHHEELVRRSMDYMEAHLAESISVEDVAEAVFISGRYLNTIFKNHTGTTVFEHLSIIRLRRAEELLRDPSLQIQEIATRVGYGNVQSFIRLFKRHHGMTPVEYRRVAGRSA
jgi:two-component system, response regulator YesN